MSLYKDLMQAAQQANANPGASPQGQAPQSYSAPQQTQAAGESLYDYLHKAAQRANGTVAPIVPNVAAANMAKSSIVAYQGGKASHWQTAVNIANDLKNIWNTGRKTWDKEPEEPQQANGLDISYPKTPKNESKKLAESERQKEVNRYKDQGYNTVNIFGREYVTEAPDENYPSEGSFKDKVSYGWNRFLDGVTNIPEFFNDAKDIVETELAPNYHAIEKSKANTEAARQLSEVHGIDTASILGSKTRDNILEKTEEFEDMDFGDKFALNAGLTAAGYGAAIVSAGITGADALTGGALSGGELGVASSIYDIANFAQSGVRGLVGVDKQLLVDNTNRLGNLVLDIESTTLDNYLSRIIGLGDSRVATGIRGFGEGAQEARDKGLGIGGQVGLGVVRAGVEIATEMLSGLGAGWRGTGYGDEMFKALDRWISKKTNSELVGTLASAFGAEAVEEMMADVLNPIADRLFKISDGDTKFLQDVWGSGQLLYDGLLGGIVGGFGGVETYAGTAISSKALGLDIATYKAAERIVNNKGLRTSFEEFTGVELSEDENSAITQAAILITGVADENYTARDVEADVIAKDASRYIEQVKLHDAATAAGEAEMDKATDGGTEQATAAADVPNTEQSETPTAESPKVETPEAPKAAKPTKSKALHESYADVESDNSSIERYAAKYEGRAGDVQQAYAEGQDVAEFGKAFDAAYRMGESMLPKTSLGKVQNLSDEQKQIAFQMGRDAANERATTRALNLVGKGAGGRGVVSGEGISLADVRKKFNDAQNTAYRVLDKFARATGVNIVLYSSDESGSREEGSFSWKDNTIRININSGVFSSGDVKDLSKYTALRTFSHELTHFTEKWNAEQYDSLRESVFEALDEKGVDVDERIQLRMAAGLSYDMASREVVADSMADMLGQSDIFERLAKKDVNMAESLLNKLKEFVARLKQAFKSMTTQNNYEAEILKDTIGYSEEMVKKWTDVLEGSIEAYNAQRKAEQPKKPREKKRGKPESIKQQSFAGRKAESANYARLDEAIKLEEIGQASSEEIRQQTGWFRGYDGKWRFEISDRNMEYYPHGYFTNPDVIRYRELSDKMLLDPENMPEAEEIELFTLNKALRGVKKTPKTLGDYVKHDNLFEAYPQLRNIDVRWEDLPDNHYGSYRPDENKIVLNYNYRDNKTEIEKTLIHEIQHAIQAEEGLAFGSTVGYWQYQKDSGFDARTSADKSRAAELERQYHEVEERDPKFFKEASELMLSLPKVPRGKFDFEKWEQIEEDPPEWTEFDRRRDELSEKYGGKLSEFMTLYNRLMSAMMDSGRSAERLYMETAGEIEARDVTERREYTTEQRKNTRPDIDREDVVFSERSSGFDEDIVQSSRGYWTPKLSQSEWDLLNRSLDKEIGKASNFLDDATKWLYANEKGVEVFALYGIGDGTEPTPLYVSRGGKASIEAQNLSRYLEGYDNETHESRRTFNGWSEAFWAAKREYDAGYDTHGHRRKTLGLDDILGKLSERNRGGNTERSTENSESLTQSNDAEQSARGRATLSDRELLEAAAARLPREGLSESEKLALVDFQKKLDKLKELQEQRVEQGRIYKEQMFTKGGNRAEAQKTKNRMDILDKKINSLENTILSMKDRDVFKKILKSARDMIEREARVSEKKTLAEYRAKRNESEGQKKYRDRIIKTARELMAWISAPSAKEGKRVPLELQEALSGLLSSIDFTSKRSLKGGDATKRDIDFKNRLQAVKDALDRNIEAVGAESGYVDIRPEFSEEYKALVAKVDSLIGEGEDYVINRMSSEELKQLSELLGEVKHYVQNANVLHENEVFKTAHEAGDESIQSMGKLGKASKGTGLAGRFFNWFYMRPAYVFSRFGKGGESIYQEFRKAQGLQARLAKEVLEFSEKTFTPEMAQRWAETTRTFNIGGEKVKIPITHIMSMYCLSKREQGLLHLLGGGFRVSNFKNGKETVTDVGHKITREKLDEILATLDQFPAAKKIADELQNYMSTVCAAWGNEVDMVRFGVPKFLEKNYFPINSDGRQLAATTDEAPMEVSLYALLNAGFTKNLRIGANNRLIVYNIFDVFANHATSMVQYRSFALPVLDTLKWFNHKNGQGVTVRDAMAKAFGSKSDEKGSGSKSYAEDFVINLLRDYNGARRGNGSGVENALLKGLSNINRVRVSYNLSTMLLQPTAIARAGMFLKGSKIIRGLGMAAKDYKSLAAEMEKHSGIALWKSLGFYDVNISRGIAEQIKQDMDWKQKLNDMGMKGAEAADRFTWAAIWAASKMSVNRAKYRTEAEYFEAVNDVFEEVIYKTQVVDSVLTKAEAQREKGFAAKSVMSFMSEAVASTSLLSNAAMQYDLDSRQMGKAKAWQKNRKHIGRAIKVWTVSKVVSAAVSALVAAWRDDDDYEDSEEKYFSALKEKLLDELNPLGDLPVLGDVISILQGYSDSSELGQIVNYFTSAYGIIMDKLDKDDDGDYEKYTWWGAMYKVLQGASAILGAPFATMSREAVDVWNNTAGRLKPEWKLHTYDPGVQNSIKYAYDDGYIGREEAIKLLIENAEESEMSATFTVDEWVMQRETGIRYGDMQKAYVSGELTDEQVRDYLVRYGHDLPKDAAEKQLQWKMEIDTGIMYSSLKNAYIDGEVSERDALGYLKKYGGLSQEDAEAKVLNWEGESEYGINIGSSTMGIKAALLNDFITAAEAKHIMMTYDGKTEQEAEVYTNQYLFTKETGYNFSDIGQAYADGVVSLDEMAEWYEKAYIHSYGEPEEAKMYAEVEEWKATVPGAEGFNKTLLEKWKNYGYNTTEAGLSKSDFAWASAIFQDTSGTDTMEKGEVFYQELYNRYLRGEISLWQLEALARSFYSSRYYKRYKFW